MFLIWWAKRHLWVIGNDLPNKPFTPVMLCRASNFDTNRQSDTKLVGLGLYIKRIDPFMTCLSCSGGSGHGSPMCDPLDTINFYLKKKGMGNWDLAFGNDLFWHKSKHKSDKTGKVKTLNLFLFWFSLQPRRTAPFSSSSALELHVATPSSSSREAQSELDRLDALSLSSLCSPLDAHCRHLCSPRLSPRRALSLSLFRGSAYVASGTAGYVNNWFPFLIFYSIIIVEFVGIKI